MTSLVLASLHLSLTNELGFIFAVSVDNADLIIPLRNVNAEINLQSPPK
jgi:hypothetical protein